MFYKPHFKGVKGVVTFSSESIATVPLLSGVVLFVSSQISVQKKREEIRHFLYELPFLSHETVPPPFCFDPF